MVWVKVTDPLHNWKYEKQDKGNKKYEYGNKTIYVNNHKLSTDQIVGKWQRLLKSTICKLKQKPLNYKYIEILRVKAWKYIQVK